MGSGGPAASARVAGCIDKSICEQCQTSIGVTAKPRVDLFLDPDTTNIKLVARWRLLQSENQTGADGTGHDQ
jgi:hypothetical protein